MKVLFAASEASPIVKVGGLGDVAGSLPKALEKLGVDVDVIIPFYSVIDRAKWKIIKQLEISVPYGNKTHTVSVYKTKLPGSKVDVILLQNELLANGGTTAFSSLKDEMDRFAFFDRAVVEYIKANFNFYDLVHCNDWHTGVITHLLEEEIGDERPATLFTIHNVAYQGQWGLELVQELGLSIPLHKILQWDLEDGNINFMVEGAASSDAVSTVSPSYAKELLLSDIGGNISEILKAKGSRFSGILNGIDYDFFNPHRDKNVHKNYTVGTYKSAKAQNKKLLQKELGLNQIDVPVYAMVSRLDPAQKGLDILFEALPKLLELDAQVIILGKGEEKVEKELTKLAHLKKYHGKLSISLGFSEGLARRIYSGADFFLMPSKTEPCGLSQMIAARYGTLPIVHSVGGLKDTIKDGINGFAFNIYSGAAFFRALDKAYKQYKSKKWEQMVQNAMECDFSWARSAKDYKELYKEVIGYNK